MSRPSEINVHIERLVLDGVAADARAVRAGVQTELARLLAGGERTPARGSPDRLDRQIARAVAGRIQDVVEGEGR